MAIQICVLTAFSLVPKNTLIRRCCKGLRGVQRAGDTNQVPSEVGIDLPRACGVRIGQCIARNRRAAKPTQRFSRPKKQYKWKKKCRFLTSNSSAPTRLNLQSWPHHFLNRTRSLRPSCPRKSTRFTDCQSTGYRIRGIACICSDVVK